MERAFRGVWIPREIWLSKELSLQEKVFLVEIDSLDNEDGCYASNKYFAEFFGLTKGRCSQVISGLEKKGYVSSEIVYGEDKSIQKRVLRVVNKLNTPPIKYPKGGSKFSKDPYLENAQDNNTKSNNTFNNINKDNIPEVENPSPDNPQPLQIKNLRLRYSPEQLKVIDSYLEMIRHTRVSAKIGESVILNMYKEWDKHPPVCVEYGLKTHTDNPAYHSKKENYTFGIIRNTTSEDAYERLTNKGAIKQHGKDEQYKDLW